MINDLNLYLLLFLLLLLQCLINQLSENDKQRGIVKEFSFMDSNQTVRHRFRCMYYMFSHLQLEKHSVCDDVL